MDHLQRVLGISQRLACQIAGQHRSTQRHQPTEPERDRALREALRQLSRAHPRWGYRRTHAVREQGWRVNRKAVQRLWREEGLRVPSQRRKRQRLGTSTTPAARLAAEHPDHVWALDYQFDQTEDGRRLKLLNVVDEHTREALTITVDRRIDADETVKVLDRLVVERGRPPRFIRMDNGPELTCERVARLVPATGAGTSYIEPGAPWQNPYVESRQPPARRAAGRGGLQQPARGPGVGGGLAHRVQHRPAPQRLGLFDPDRLRQGLDRHPSRTLIADGPTTEVRSGGRRGDAQRQCLRSCIPDGFHLLTTSAALTERTSVGGRWQTLEQ